MHAASALVAVPCGSTLVSFSFPVITPVATAQSIAGLAYPVILYQSLYLLVSVDKFTFWFLYFA